MNRTVVAVVAVVVGLAIIVGVALAFSGGGSNDSAQVPTPTLTPGITLTPSATAATPTATVTATVVPSATPVAPTATSSPGQSASATPVAPGATSTPAPPTPTLEPDRKAVPAPIDKLEIVTLESFPPQYVAQIMAGLPDGCTRQYSHSVERNGNQIDITVLNSVPTQIVACTQIYGNYSLNLNLGSQFQSGTTYTVKVNDQTTTFTAQ